MLLVMWVRASTVVTVSKDLWDKLLSVLSCFTDWVELVQEWAVRISGVMAVNCVIWK